MGCNYRHSDWYATFDITGMPGPAGNCAEGWFAGWPVSGRCAETYLAGRRITP